MDKFYIAVQISENGKYYAYAIEVAENENLVSKLQIKNIVAANVCKTKKTARLLVNFWNDCYKQNGTYMFDETF